MSTPVYLLHTAGMVGQLLRHEREQRGLSQREFGALIGMSRAYLAQVEGGSPKWPEKYIPAISQELGVSQSELARVAGKITAEIIRPEYSRVANAINEIPTEYEVEESTEDLLGKAHALVDQVNPRYLRNVVATLKVMSRAQ